MENITGTSNKLLEVDLSNGIIKTSFINQKDREMYLGGKGLGMKLLYDQLENGIDPLSEKNIIVFMMGVFMGTGAPCSARFDAITKSPLTNIMVSSSCGGPFGMAFKTAGYDGLLLKGKANKPVYLKINNNGASIEDASEIWGKDTDLSQEYFNLGSKDGAMVIGPAGENLVKFANVKSGHRFLGRGGIGAVLGSKNIKAIVALGGAYKITPKNPEQFKKLTKKGVRYINNNHFTAILYRKYGTASHTMKSNDACILPVNNFKDGMSVNAHQISGESYSEEHESKFSSCKACPILCGHKGNFKDGKTKQFPEYETTGLLGSNLGNYDKEALAEYNEKCGLLGMDSISTGTTLSFVMEASEKGLMKTALKFGESNGIIEMLENIATRKGVGDDIANGLKWLSEKYGGKEFAMHVKGMELSAYDPRGSMGQGLSYAVANRGGCHLSATVFALEVTFGFLNPNTTKNKAKYTDYLENLFSAINSLHTCQFTTYAYMLEPFIAKYTPAWLMGFMMQHLANVAIKLIDVSLYNKIYSAITGINLTQKEMFKIGKRIHLLERYMNSMEGISSKDDTLPGRLLNEPCLSDKKKRVVPLQKMLKKYYQIKGYDANGLPSKKTLNELGIILKS